LVGVSFVFALHSQQLTTGRTSQIHVRSAPHTHVGQAVGVRTIDDILGNTQARGDGRQGFGDVGGAVTLDVFALNGDCRACKTLLFSVEHTRYHKLVEHLGV